LKPPSVSSLPIPISAVTEIAPVAILASRPTTPSVLVKQEAQPAAKSCSGLVPAPFPPSAGGNARRTSSFSSELTARPSRPVAETTAV
jgi:hypothetical protein